MLNYPWPMVWPTGGGGSFSISREALADSITLSLGVLSAINPDELVWKTPPGMWLLTSLNSPSGPKACLTRRAPLPEDKNTWEEFLAWLILDERLAVPGFCAGLFWIVLSRYLAASGGSSLLKTYPPLPFSSIFLLNSFAREVGPSFKALEAIKRRVLFSVIDSGASSSSRRI